MRFLMSDEASYVNGAVIPVDGGPHGVAGRMADRPVGGAAGAPNGRRGTNAMTDRSEIEARVKKVLAEQLAVDEAQVVPDARFAEDLNADSLDLVEAVLALEEEWSIEIPEEEMESVKTVGGAVDLVAAKVGAS